MNSMTIERMVWMVLMLFVAVVCLCWVLRRRPRSPICPRCEQRMGWSLTCRRCGRAWGSQGDLRRELRANDRRAVRQIRREEASKRGGR